MKQSETTRKSLMIHCQKYPFLQIQDIFKYIYQSTFGCEHLVSSLESSTALIHRESKSMLPYNETLVDPLDGTFSRVHLSYLNQGLSVETLSKLFLESSKSKQGDKSELESKIQVAKELVRENKLPFSIDEFDKSALKWKGEGYPSVHHSDIFKKEYNPSYRVISNKYVPFLPFLSKLDTLIKNNLTVIAIEGGSASGKTTLGEVLKVLYDCTVFHTDDFFLRPEQRTPERYSEVGGNFDRERFIEDILVPLKKNEPIFYRKFDCSTMTISPSTKVVPKSLVIIEGVYSMHPELKKYYDFSVFLDISPELQKERISKRNSPQIAKQFYEKWIPLEQTYFLKTEIKNRCDISILISK